MSRQSLIELSALRVLSYQLRVASHSQLIAGLARMCSSNTEAVIAALRRLRQQRLLSSARIPVVKIELTEPIASWFSGRPAPDFDAVAWFARHRLATASTKRERIYWASPLAANRVGGVGGRLRKPLQIDHDLGVAAMFFARFRQDASTIGRWLGEDAYARLRRRTRGQKQPDAVLISASDRIEIVLDYLSQYTVAHLRSFHHYWAVRNTHYEWW